MKKITLLCIISALLLTTSCKKVTPNPPTLSLPTTLCGIWYGYGYECLSGSISKEIIMIEHNGNFVRATKLVGDNCVNSGQVTWEGYITSNPVDITIFAGNGDYQISHSTSLQIENLNYITLPYVGIEFVRATTEEIEGEIQEIYFNTHGILLNIDMEGICKPQNY